MNATTWQALFGVTGSWPWLFVATAFLYAQLRGDRTSRLVANVWLLSAILGFMLSAKWLDMLGSRGDQLVSECLLLAVQIAVCLRTPRFYPIVISAAQLLVVMVTMTASLGAVAHPATAIAVNCSLGFAQICTLAYGLAAYRSRRPIWRVRRRAENPNVDLARRANHAR